MTTGQITCYKSGQITNSRHGFLAMLDSALPRVRFGAVITLLPRRVNCRIARLLLGVVLFMQMLTAVHACTPVEREAGYAHPADAHQRGFLPSPGYCRRRELRGALLGRRPERGYAPGCGMGGACHRHPHGSSSGGPSCRAIVPVPPAPCSEWRPADLHSFPGLPHLASALE